MKVVAFEVREDEREEFARQALREGVDELELFSAPLDETNEGLVGDADAVLVLGRSQCDRVMLERLARRNVRALVTRTIGMDHIDLAAARELELAVANSCYAPDSVADFTLMLMLVALRKYKPAIFRQAVNDYSLPGLMGQTLSSMTVGVVGAGAIGSAVIERLQGFGSTVLVCGHHVPGRLAGMALPVSMEELMRRSDLITLHVPSRPENVGLVNDDTLVQMRDGVVLVNTARGDLMDTGALIRGIESGKIGALAMDVFAEEDEIYHNALVNDIIANRDMAYLRQFPNTVLTQHMAFYTQQSVDEMVSHALDAALALNH